MNKKFILSLALIALISVFSFSVVGAQDEEALPACDMVELATGMEDLMAPLTDLGEMMVFPESGEPSDYSEFVAGVDAYAFEYWTTFSETEFSCAEQQFIAYTIGLTLDELLIITELSALALHESVAGNADSATVFTDLATARSESLNEDMTAMGDIVTNMMSGEVDTGEEFEACSEEELAASSEGLLAINEGYMELGESLGEASGNDLTAAVAGFATLSTEYWTTFIPELPECAEAQEFGTAYGLLLDDTLIMVGLLKLAEYEAEAGNDELSETLATSASARAEILTATAEEVFGALEEEE